jgi:diamine N-acetyltransferase
MPFLVELREITDENRRAVEGLRVSVRQEQFVASVAESLEEAESSSEAHPWYRAIYADDVPVGFVMISEAGEGDDRYPWRLFLWRLLIDERFQRQGYGTETLNAVVKELRTRSGVDALFTSAVPGDGSPVSFYEHYGFVRTGQIFDDELVLRLDLGGSACA